MVQRMNVRLPLSKFISFSLVVLRLRSRLQAKGNSFQWINAFRLKAGLRTFYLNPPKNTPSIAAGLDGDEFGIVGVSLTINLCYNSHSSLKLELGRSGGKSAG